jgi:hypothetical protein
MSTPASPSNTEAEPSAASQSDVEAVARIIDPDEWLAVDRQRLTTRGRIVTITDAVKEQYCKRSLRQSPRHPRPQSRPR